MKKFFCFAVFLLIARASVAQYSAMTYISAHKDAAIQIMKEHGIPASIVLGVAMHESANGNSTVARKLNNHFGIKGRISHYLHKKKRVKTAYKKYDSALDSYEDFAGVLTERKQFAHLSDTYSADDYEGWARGIQRNGYAASRVWASQVMGIIRKYNLDEFDQPENDGVLAESVNENVFIPVAMPAPPEPVTTVKKISEVKFYRVKKGDNLSVIAKKTGRSVSTIRKKNHLKSTQLKPGQRLKL